MINEEWKPIPDFEGHYEASNTGKIRSVSRTVKSGRGYKTIISKILKTSIDEWGYEKVCLSKNNKQYHRKVNRLVALAFIPNPNNLPQVNHKDGIKINNSVENLEWCNASENMLHCYANGLSNWETKIRIVETDEVFNSITECARTIKGYVSLIDACLSGKRKTHKGYHFEVVGERASDKYKRNNYKSCKQTFKSSRYIEHHNENHTIREWSEILNIPYHTLEVRYYRGDRGNRLFRKVNKNGKCKQ